MSLLDKQNILSDAQTLVHAAGSWNSENILDLWGSAALPAGPLGTPPFDVGLGCCKKILAQITETFLAAAGAATLQLTLVNDSDPGLATTPKILAKTEAIAKADLVAGYRFQELSIIPAKCTQRYLGVIITIATNPGTAGKLTIAIGHDFPTSPGSFT